jgi:hypothetical protein
MLREERRWWLRRILGLKWKVLKEVRGKCITRRFVTLPLSNIIRIIKSRRMRWAWHVVRMAGKKNTCMGLTENIKRKRSSFISNLSDIRQVHSQSSSSVICQTTGPQPLPKRFLHLTRSRASSFKWEYPLLSPRSSSNCLRLLPRLLVTSLRPFIFPSITSFRRQFLRKMWPIQKAYSVVNEEPKVHLQIHILGTKSSHTFL